MGGGTARYLGITTLKTWSVGGRKECKKRFHYFFAVTEGSDENIGQRGAEW